VRTVAVPVRAVNRAGRGSFARGARDGGRGAGGLFFAIVVSTMGTKLTNDVSDSDKPRWPLAVLLVAWRVGRLEAIALRLDTKRVFC